MRTSSLRAFWLAAMLLPAGSALAQWTTQTITLQPGWNAVYLEVQPEPRQCDAIFAGIPVESVWMWNRRFSSVQFILDANELTIGQPDWLAYVPPSNPGRGTMNLHTLLAGRCYLIKLQPSGVPVTWTVVGRPSLRAPEWLSDSWNFVGFMLPTLAPPTFQQFFANSTAHAGQSIYRMNSSQGRWELVGNQGPTLMRDGEAFWVFTRGTSEYPGTMSVQAGGSKGLSFGRVLDEQTVRVRNNTSAPKVYRLRPLNSIATPTGDQPGLAGPVILSYYRLNISAVTNDVGWAALPNELTSPSVSPGAEWVVRLQVQRTAFPVYQGVVGTAGVEYQSLLEISDGTTSRRVIPATADGYRSYRSTAGGFAIAATAEPDPRAGLWVGSVSLNAVNQPANVSAPDALTPVATPLQFRMLVHVDEQGKARLLQRVLLMWRDGYTDGNHVFVSGHYVLVTDESLTDLFKGSTLKDGVQVPRRFSTVAFSLRQPEVFNPVVVQGGPTSHFGDPDSQFRLSTRIEYDDPLNPFLHRFHPDHDNLDEEFDQKIAAGLESYTITRDIQLQFTGTDSEGPTVGGRRDGELFGIYTENLIGLHRNTLRIKGSFRLTQVALIGKLNDGIHN